MLPTRHVDRYLQFAPPDRRDVVMELRSLIVSIAPTVTEAIDRHGLLYFWPERGGPVSAGLCRISIHPDHVRLAFMHGAFFPDPLGLLEGDGKAKRFVRIASYDAAPWDNLKSLLECSARFDPRRDVPANLR